MTKLLKKNDFHKPFIKELVFVALVTIVSMISVRYFLPKIFIIPPKSHQYTTQESQNTPD